MKDEKLQFENETILSLQEYEKLTKFNIYHCKKVSFIFLVICIVILVLASIGLVFLKQYIQGSIYLAISLFGVFWLIKSPSIIAKKMLKDNKLLNIKINTFRFFETYFVFSNGLTTIKEKYENILIYETKANYYIYMDKNTMIILVKSGFKTKDNFSDFCEKKLKKRFKSRRTIC
ncbi:MAG: hypothetical protein RSB76_02575 [Clostridia bacterium]